MAQKDISQDRRINMPIVTHIVRILLASIPNCNKACEKKKDTHKAMIFFPATVRRDEIRQ